MTRIEARASLNVSLCISLNLKDSARSSLRLSRNGGAHSLAPRRITPLFIRDVSPLFLVQKLSYTKSKYIVCSLQR